MSDHSQPLDDVSIELATIVDEFSAVAYYRMKKEPPMQVSTKKPVSFRMFAKTDFPEARPDGKQKLPKSMDMNYIDMISGKCHFTINKEKKVPISPEEFEKICNYPLLTLTPKQDISERSTKVTEEEMSSSNVSSETDEDDQEETSCSPCCNRRSPKDKEKQLETVLKNSEDSKDGTQSKEISATYRSLQSSDISEGSTESNHAQYSTLKKSTESSQEISTKTNATENASSNNNGSSSEGKKEKKKGIFKRMFSKKKKEPNDEYSPLIRPLQPAQEIDENSQEISTKTNVTENTSSNDNGSNSEGKMEKKKGIFKRMFSKKQKDHNDENSTEMKPSKSSQGSDEHAEEVSTTTNVTESTSSNDNGSNSDEKTEEKERHI